MGRFLLSFYLSHKTRHWICSWKNSTLLTSVLTSLRQSFQENDSWNAKYWTDFEKPHFSLSCGFSLFLCIFCFISKYKCDDFSVWWLCWVGGFFVCSTHHFYSSNFVCIHSMLLRPKDKKIQTGNLSTAAAPSCGATAFPTVQVCPVWVQLVLIMPHMTLPEFAFSINLMASLMWTASVVTQGIINEGLRQPWLLENYGTLNLMEIVSIAHCLLD